MTDSAKVPSIEVTATAQEDGTILVEWPYDGRLWKNVQGVPYIAVVMTANGNTFVVRHDIYPLSEGNVVVWPRWGGTTTIHTVVGVAVSRDEIDRINPRRFFQFIRPPETNGPGAQATTVCQVAVTVPVKGLRLGDPQVTEVWANPTPKARPLPWL